MRTAFTNASHAGEGKVVLVPTGWTEQAAFLRQVLPALASGSILIEESAADQSAHLSPEIHSGHAYLAPFSA
ncbi:hypothetical protein [Planctomycetes bacterium Poly30]|uniref:hypothetical protein n=1 Tax=Saltatorellus ferox TaxID=2528018 RepID=UPI0011AA0C36